MTAPLSQSYWPADTSITLWDYTLADLVRDAADTCPDQVALVHIPEDDGPRIRWTYAEFLAEVENTARALMQSYAPGERIGIYAQNSGDWVIIQHGAAMAGLILVPVNPAYEKGELANVLASAELSAIFYAPNFRGRNLLEIVEQAEADNDAAPLRAKYSLDNWRDVLGTGDPDAPFPKVTPEDTVLIQFTSGTTGAPKGARLHHKGVINMGRFVGERVAFPERGVWINAMPMFHVGGAVVTELAAFSRRGAFVVAPGFDPAQMLELIESERGNCTLIVPTMIHAMMTHDDFTKRDLSSLVTVLTGAAPVAEALAKQVINDFDCQLSILFGQTELNGVISQTRVSDSIEDQCATLGQPLPQMEVCIANPENGDIMPIGEQGEIWARGYQAMSGYWGNEEATKQTITADGWLRMGDIGTMDDRGFLRITSRLKDIIIRGGMNIYPREIEEVLAQHPAISQISILGIEDAHWGEVVGAVILPANADSPPNIEELRQYCRKYLAAHKTPSKWFFVESYPMTPSGKIQKFELVDMIQHGEITEISNA